MPRTLNLLLALIVLPLLLAPLAIVYLALLMQNNGTPIFWSKRIGINSSVFLMPKFRTMMQSAPIVATDKLQNPSEFVTPLGAFLRKSSLDELPQIYSILIGHMNFVGPRPALYNQFDLIELRKAFLVDKIRPGLTGLAQISGRDELTIEEKVSIDLAYAKTRSMTLDLYIIFKTFKKVIHSEGIKH